ncbi:hypothetical protein CC2G_004710 [Coprinopsis cinerea AmutBmut pab1-1]|nr:hypothetical protein CC2G_004710 [Coprinopsis cinerea AmutBmut pab1-1]
MAVRVEALAQNPKSISDAGVPSCRLSSLRRSKDPRWWVRSQRLLKREPIQHADLRALRRRGERLSETAEFGFQGRGLTALSESYQSTASALYSPRSVENQDGKYGVQQSNMRGLHATNTVFYCFP